MTALTVGVTAALPACKRGLAVNLAASLARGPAGGGRVCVVDVDPFELDVTTRLAVHGPCLEDFADGPTRSTASLAVVHEPPLWVLPSAGAASGLAQRAAAHALTELRGAFDYVICDLVAGPAGLVGVPGGLVPVDWLLLAVTPDVEPVAAAARLLDELDDARMRGDLAPTVRVGVVLTGDEGSIGDPSTDLSPEVVARALGRPVVGSVRQLWGRARPNLGFGAALGIAELDDAVADLFGGLGAPRRVVVGPDFAVQPATSRAS